MYSEVSHSLRGLQPIDNALYKSVHRTGPLPYFMGGQDNSLAMLTASNPDAVRIEQLTQQVKESV
jgi:hypothetical protein